MKGAIETRQEDVKRLIAVMRSPRYWRDRDPELLRLVELGFKKIYRRQALGGSSSSEMEERGQELRLSA